MPPPPRQRSRPPARAAAAPVRPAPPAARDEAYAAAFALHRAGDVAGAEAAYRAILARHPDHAGALHRLGVAHMQRGQLEEARRLIERAVHARPAFPEAWHNLGFVCEALNDRLMATAHMRKAIALEPNYARGHFGLGNVLNALGQHDEAESAYRRAVEIKPDFVDALSNLGALLHLRSRGEEAEVFCRRAIAIDPRYLEAHNNLGNVLRVRGKHTEALASYARAHAIDPRRPEPCGNSGLVYMDMGRYDEAETWIRRALELRPNYVDAINHYGLLLKNKGRYGEAVAQLQRALALRPENAEALNNLGSALILQGKLDEAEVAYRNALKVFTDFIGAHSNLLTAMQYREGVDPETLLAAHREWNRRHCARYATHVEPHANGREPDRPLTIGLLSGDLARHPVGYFVMPFMRMRDRRQLRVICYSDRRLPDPMTQEFQALSDAWRDIRFETIDAIVAMVRADEVDILVDLAGHFNNRRIAVLARKPAPVQATWAGYVGTTGMGAIDYLIADRHHVRADEERHSVEHVIRLPAGYVCYEPPDYAPAVGALPAAANGFITFGCLNNFPKLRPPVAALWARILAAVPGSRLLLANHSMDDPESRALCRGMFVAAGVDPARLVIEGRAPHPEFLASYNRIDIALDPFPYSGGLTTCEALWMGVPVVTMPGDTFAGRHSTSHVTTAGFPELVATDSDDYVARAVALARDRPRLAALRAALRPRMAASPLCDAAGFATALGGAFREMWRHWCMETPADSRRAASLAAARPAPAAAVTGAPTIKPPPGPRLRIAVISPYYKEAIEVLRQCHDSIRGQSYPCRHFLVADGHPNRVIDAWDADHVALSRAHGDGGNMPRAVGSMSAISQGYDAIHYLDADNWITPDHVERMVELKHETQAAVCIAMRTLVTLDGEFLCEDTFDSDGINHVDTSCFVIFRPAFRLTTVWGMMPKELWPLCDRIFWSAIQAQKLPVARATTPTVLYRTVYEYHYRSIGEKPPPGAKSGDPLKVARAWWNALTEERRADLQKFLTTGAW